MADPNDTCLVCKVALNEYEAEDDPISRCRFCGQEVHTECKIYHACDGRVQADQALLKAWKAGVRGW